GLDEKLLASGVYRYKRTDALASDEIVFYRDGKTASVVFRRDPHGLGVLATNGKPDASIQLEEGKEASLDESTMTVAAALPLAYLPNARRVANIGMGSGQTAHVLLGDPDLEVVDTIEIETEMVEASRNYMSAVWRAYQDPRSRIHIEDAKTFFSLNNYTYDIIIAEPSNPWVSGVSSLFSREFYAAVTDYLADDGVFVQWIQMYEFTDELAISILKALSENFDDFTIYLSNSSDVILVARKNGAMGEPDWQSVLGGDLGASLARVGIHNETDLDIRRSATKANILPFLTDTPVLANSDYFPYVDLNAGRALFKGSASGMFASWMIAPLPVLEMLNDSSPRFSEVSSGHPLQRAELVDSSAWLYDKMTRTGMADPTETDVVVEPLFVYSADWLIASQETCSAEKNPQRWSDAATDLLSFTLAHLEPDQAATMVDAVVRSACQLQDDPEVQAWLSLYNAVARRDGGGMYVTARAILENAPDLDDHRQGYAIGAAMLGALAAGEARLAYDVWSEFGTALYEERKLPAYMKLIVSISARFDD
ncbi:MAG: hypothetical protein ACE5F8_04155, partial [Woeseiaceae bacterium]